MCDICEFLLTAEHDESILEQAREHPCPRCRKFPASFGTGDDDFHASAIGHDGERPDERHGLCYHCWVKDEGMHEDCPVCAGKPETAH